MAGAGMQVDDGGKLTAYQPAYVKDVDSKGPGEGESGTALAAPKKVYKDGDKKTIGGVEHTRINGAWMPAQ